MSIQERIAESFRNFDKWETYGVAFDAMSRRQITLREIQAIALEETGIRPEVIAMRRRDVLGMWGGLKEHREWLRREVQP